MGRPKMYDDELRERLIDEASRLLQDDGYNAVSLRTLTKNVGTSTNAVYTLFGSKESLMAEVIVREADYRLKHALASAPDTSSLTRLIYLTIYFRELANSSPTFFRGFISAVGDAQQGITKGRQNADVLSLTDRVFQPLFDVCQGIKSEYNLEDSDPADIALSFWGALHGLIDLEIDGLLANKVQDVDGLYLRTVHALYLGWVSGETEKLAPGVVDAFVKARGDHVIDDK